MLYTTQISFASENKYTETPSTHSVQKGVTLI